MHENAVGRHDYEEGLRYNQQFRFGIYQAARMPALLAIIEGLWLQTAPFFNYLYPSDEVSQQTCKAYASVLEGLKKRDGKVVSGAICQSIRIGTQYLIAGIERDVFTEDRNTAADEAAVG
jgi:DNA-binding GntR family transcriptional regulator